MATPTLAERISASFTAWECRGRGWQVAEYPVSLEPPYRPFFLLPTTGAAIQHVDDGRRPTRLSSLYEKVVASFVGERTQPAPSRITYEEEPLFPAFERGAFTGRAILLDKDFSSSVDVAGELLRALSVSNHPVSFELVGHDGKVAVHVTCADVDADRVFASITDYVPDAVLIEDRDALRSTWNTSGASLIVDYGLSNEFFLPLACSGSLKIDPYIPLVSALARAGEGETLCFQVLFEGARNSWRSAVLDAVTAPDGSSIFSDAPEFVSLAREKVQSPILACVLRIGACAEFRERALDLVRGTNAFVAQFARPDGNALIPLANDEYSDKAHELAFLHRLSFRAGMILSADELVGLVHLPCESVRQDALVRADRRTKAVPVVAKGHPFIIGENVHRGIREPVSLALDRRLSHNLVVGASGTGKSTLLLNMIRQDIEQGYGVAALDPHGDLIDDVLRYVPDDRRDDVVLFDPSDEEWPVGFNIVAAANEREKILLASDLAGIFQRLSTSWGDTMSTVLSNAVLALLESRDGGTLLHLRRFLADEKYRIEFLKTVSDEEVQFFWRTEWPLIGSRSIGPLLSRLNAFLRPKLIRHIVGQRVPRFSFDTLMSSRKIFLGKLSQGLIGNENAYLLGSLILSKLLQCALSRQATARDERQPFFLYLDEAEHFVTPSVASIIAESRKFGVGLTLGCQSLAPLRKSPEVYSAVLANAHTRIMFRVGDDDARTLAESTSFFTADDLRSLARGQAIVRIGEATNDCNISTYAPPTVAGDIARARHEALIERSRTQFAARLVDLSSEIAEIRQTPEEPAPSLVRKKEEVPVPPESQATVQALQPPAVRTGAERPKRRTAEVPETSQLGRGGPEHKYLQHLIKRLGEERGFRAVIEEGVDGGQVDVALRRDSLTIACEVSITTDTAHELDNARKCLGSGFAHVWIVVPVKKRREKLVQASAELGAAVSVIGADELVAAFDTLAPATASAERIVGGFKVKATRRVTSYEDYQKRQSAIAEVIARSLVKGRKKE